MKNHLLTSLFILAYLCSLAQNEYKELEFQHPLRYFDYSNKLKVFKVSYNTDIGKDPFQFLDHNLKEVTLSEKEFSENQKYIFYNGMYYNHEGLFFNMLDDTKVFEQIELPYVPAYYHEGKFYYYYTLLLAGPAVIVTGFDGKTNSFPIQYPEWKAIKEPVSIYGSEFKTEIQWQRVHTNMQTEIFSHHYNAYPYFTHRTKLNYGNYIVCQTIGIGNGAYARILDLNLVEKRIEDHIDFPPVKLSGENYLMRVDVNGKYDKDGSLDGYYLIYYFTSVKNSTLVKDITAVMASYDMDGNKTAEVSYPLTQINFWPNSEYLTYAPIPLQYIPHENSFFAATKYKITIFNPDFTIKHIHKWNEQPDASKMSPTQFYIAKKWLDIYNEYLVSDPKLAKKMNVEEGPNFCGYMKYEVFTMPNASYVHFQNKTYNYFVKFE